GLRIPRAGPRRLSLQRRHDPHPTRPGRLRRCPRRSARRNHDRRDDHLPAAGRRGPLDRGPTRRQPGPPFRHRPRRLGALRRRSGPPHGPRPHPGRAAPPVGRLLVQEHRRARLRRLRDRQGRLLAALSLADGVRERCHRRRAGDRRLRRFQPRLRRRPGAALPAGRAGLRPRRGQKGPVGDSLVPDGVLLLSRLHRVAVPDAGGRCPPRGAARPLVGGRSGWIAGGVDPLPGRAALASVRGALSAAIQVPAPALVPPRLRRGPARARSRHFRVAFRTGRQRSTVSARLSRVYRCPGAMESVLGDAVADTPRRGFGQRPGGCAGCPGQRRLGLDRGVRPRPVLGIADQRAVPYPGGRQRHLGARLHDPISWPGGGRLAIAAALPNRLSLAGTPDSPFRPFVGPRLDEHAALRLDLVPAVRGDFPVGPGAARGCAAGDCLGGAAGGADVAVRALVLGVL
ncbi:MAG: hypothetical protein AVDCRST_MAG73-3556, partial [uncultured Thermomicrobiales bacterium]